MSTLPSKASFTGASVTEGAYKTAMDTLRDYLDEIIGASGDQVPGHGHARLTWTSATLITLSGWMGMTVPVKTSGVWKARKLATAVTAANTNIYLNGTPASNLAANTTYQVYLFDNSGVLTIDYSTTGFAADTTNGVHIKSGDSTRTYVGYVITDGSAQFTQANVHAQYAGGDLERLFGAFGDLATWTGTGLTRLLRGTSGQHLRITDGLVCGWVGGGWEEVEKVTPGAVTSVEFAHTMVDGFEYAVLGRGISSTSAAAWFPFVRFRNDAGTLLSGATDYYYGMQATGAAGLQQGDSKVLPYHWSGFTGIADASAAFDWLMTIEKPLDTAVRTRGLVDSCIFLSGSTARSWGSYTCQTIDGHTKITVALSAGNFDAGELHMLRRPLT